MGQSKQQTAVEWLEQEIDKVWKGDIMYMELPRNVYYKLLEQAKAIEKEQLNKCYNHGSFSLIDNGHGDTFEQYYNEMYNHSNRDRL